MKLFLLTSLLATTTTLYAQLTVRSLMLTDPSAAVVYIGVDNPIEVSGMSSNVQNQFVVNGGGSSLTMLGLGKFIIRATKRDTVTFTILRKNKLVLEKRFAVRKLPDQQVTLADSASSSTLSKELILSKPQLDITFPGSLYKHSTDGIKIISFTMAIDKEDKVIEVPTTSNKLSEKQLLLIKESAPRATITFDKIRASFPDGTNRQLPSLVYYLQ